MQGKAKPRVIIEAVVIRGNGTVENLGKIADSKDGTIKKFLRRVKKNG